ncbi:MAG: alpha/beta hydrolase [Gemmataceae bacterium]
MTAISSLLRVRSPLRKILIRVSVCLVVGYVGAIVVLLALQDRLLYHPLSASNRWIDPPAKCEVEEVYLRSADGMRIHGRWWPCNGTKQAILFCHSRSGNLSLALLAEAVAQWHRELGSSLFIFDYPGYGRSEGTPTEEGCYAAAAAAYSWLTETQRIRPRDLLIVGRSLGSAVAIDLAGRRPHRALVLISPFTSLPDVAQSHYPFLPARWLIKNRFDSFMKIRQCHRPIIIVHGTRDRTVPFAQGKRLFEGASEPKVFVAVEGAGHDDSVLVGLFPNLREFLANATVSESEDP